MRPEHLYQGGSLPTLARDPSDDGTPNGMSITKVNFGTPDPGRNGVSRVDAGQKLCNIARPAFAIAPFGFSANRSAHEIGDINAPAAERDNLSNVRIFELYVQKLHNEMVKTLRLYVKLPIGCIICSPSRRR